MNQLNDSIELRARRIAAYRAGAYQFPPPPVYCGGWDEEAWCNFVTFTDTSLNGFLPYDDTKHRQAQCATL